MTLASNCYGYMFSGCTGLTSAPKLPATTLAEGCYSNMFNGCTGLVTAPSLPAFTLDVYCYYYMFKGCTSLTSAPMLSATTLANYCYNNMFSGCTGLTTAPELPATTLAYSCYSYMFRGCTGLTTAPELPAATLTDYCYNYMFYGCSSLSYVKAAFTTTPSSTYTLEWLTGVRSTGTFVKNAAATWNVSGATGIPYGWTVETYSVTNTNGHDYVDLGLSYGGNKILFATMNLGASSPEEYGDYYAWGESTKRYTSIIGSTVTGGTFTWANAPYHTGDDYVTGWTKYIPTGQDSYWSGEGSPDNKLELDASDDIVRKEWGGDWRMPTRYELALLVNNCTWEYTADYNGTGVKGYVLTGSNGNTLFLPFAGYCDGTVRFNAGSFCYLWSSSLYPSTPRYAWYLYPRWTSEDDAAHDMNTHTRYRGFSVRAVLPVPIE